jgi:hypothetical protein
MPALGSKYDVELKGTVWMVDDALLHMFGDLCRAGLKRNNL